MMCREESCNRPAKIGDKSTRIVRYSVCHEHYVEICKKSMAKRRGPDRYIDKDGYVQVRQDGVTIAEHRAVMQVKLGRKLNKYENVHHKNGDRADNTLDNLELWSKFQPAGQRVEDKVAFAKEILRLYEPDSLSERKNNAKV